MMRSILTICCLIWTLSSCQSGTDKLEEKAFAGQIEVKKYEMTPDTIEIHGKFTGSCEAPPRTIKIREYNSVYSRFNKISVINGAFTYKLYLKEPRQIMLRGDQLYFDFFVTTKEKLYNIEFTCSGSNISTQVKDSPENAAFAPFAKEIGDLRDNLQGFDGEDLSNKKEFDQVKDVFKNHQETMVTIAKEHPGTFVADVLCPSEILPEATFSSIDDLRKKYFHRDVLADPYYYNTLVSSRIVTNFTDAIFDKSHPDFGPFADALDIADKNKQAAIRLQQVFRDIFYYGHKEELLMGYIDWINNHPDEVKNLSVQANLKIISKSMPGNHFIEVALQGPDGQTKRLSETVAQAKLTLLIFYSPTCSHCQEELPELIPVWNQYKDKGLKIFAVGFDASDPQWKWFMKNKGSEEWTNVFEPPQGDMPSEKYSVGYTPTFVLIDKDGKIISRFAGITEVKQKIPELLK